MGTHVHPWLIHVNVWQNQYSIVNQNKVKIKIKKKKEIVFQLTTIQSEEKRQIPCAELVGVPNGIASVKSSMAVPQKMKSRITI